jgi:hypothetical protein
LVKGAARVSAGVWTTDALNGSEGTEGSVMFTVIIRLSGSVIRRHPVSEDFPDSARTNSQNGSRSYRFARAGLPNPAVLAWI